MKFSETNRVITLKIEFEAGEAPITRTHWFSQTQANDAAELVQLEYRAHVSPGNNNEELVRHGGFHGMIRSLKDPSAVSRETISTGDVPPHALTLLRNELAKRMNDHMRNLVWH